MQAVVADLLTNYYSEGNGKVLLMLHGWGDDARTFAGLTEELKQNYRVVSVDLPGFGKTQIPSRVWGLGDYAVFIKDLTSKLDIIPYAVIAHSNGGSVAIKAVAGGLLTPEKLVLLGSAGIRDREKFKKLVLKIIAKSGKLLTFWLPEKYKKKLRKKLYGVAGSDIDVVPHLRETFKKTVKEDVQSDAAVLKTPTLLIYGSDDKATPPEYGETYKKLISNSQLEIINGEHLIHHDNPDKVAELIKGFLDR